ncbi:single-stranded DNA-binding protein [Methylosinus sp. PW1]|uniref:single-stranded DNA-binding protein n=1 Tax=Methylosinus sp. PW1 TaxID=107636 RepID=UPI0005699AB1|nr:single-stranded DNA-binding protein [Methylosinus sp. PW1]
MAGSVNKVILIGHLGRDPESRTTGAGSRVVIFSLATSESWRDKDSGERRQRTEWHNVVVYNEPLGKIAEQYLRKGSLCYLEGQLATRSYTDKDGVERKVTEILLKAFRGELALLDRAERAAPDESDYGRESARRPHDDPRMAMGDTPRAPISQQIDDDIPF